MTLHQLKIFDAVARYVNISQASRELHLSEPSVCVQLKSLQEACGIKLYRKVRRGIELTPEGRAFQAEAGKILLQIDKLGEKFGFNLSSAKATSLIVGGSHGPSVSLLPSILAAFKKSHPFVRVTLRTKSSAAVERYLLNSEIEIALISNPSMSPLFKVEPYRQEMIVAVVSARHPLAKKKELTLADVAQGPLIIRSQGGVKTRAILKQVEEQGYKLNIFMECESAEGVKIATIKGMGLGFLYKDYVEFEVSKTELKILKIPELKTSDARSFIIYDKRKPLSPLARDFLDMLHEARGQAERGLPSEFAGSQIKENRA